MSVVQTLIGNVKGPKGDTGATGATGASGPAATIAVGSTTTTAYGNAASVTNSGTSSAAVFDFVIPQGKPGEATTTIGDLLLDSITSSAADFPSPQVGDTGKTAFGKINKFFSDVLTKFTQQDSNVATISASPTTQAFSKGDYLVYNGLLYKVTANIANGGTITPETNVTQTKVGTQLDAINDALVPATANTPTAGTNVTIDSIFMYKMLGFAWIAGQITTSASIGSSAALISGLYSAADTIPIPMVKDGGAVRGNVRASGELHFAASTAAGTYVFNAVYKCS